MQIQEGLNMRTSKYLLPTEKSVYICELEHCSVCGSALEQGDYLNGRKVVQTTNSVLSIGYYGKQCANPTCSGYRSHLRSFQWQQIAPLNGTYGFDVIANIGWQRQQYHQTYDEIHRELSGQLQISKSQVRYLYNEHYLPLLACNERSFRAELEQVSSEQGLILGLDGLAPEGGEPQLWLIREVRTGLTIRSGWLSKQSQEAFENFLRPISEQGFRVSAVMSDRQRGLVPAVKVIFPEAKYAFCQSHYLGNIAEPLTDADQTMKVALRKDIRQEIGELIRTEQVEQPGVLTVTGMLPSPIEDEATEKTTPSHPFLQEQEEIETALKNRVRYLLTLKGRPPFCLAGIEMYEQLEDVSGHLMEMIAFNPAPCLLQLQHGIDQALGLFEQEYFTLAQGAQWLMLISDILDPEDNPQRNGQQVKTEILTFLHDIEMKSQNNPFLSDLARQIKKTTLNYLPGLCHTYDIPDLPRTNNDRESEFRALNQQLLRTTGQNGATRRLIQRTGAWEFMTRPTSLQKTVEAISTVDHPDYLNERKRMRQHRNRFRLCTRSKKFANKKLKSLVSRWKSLFSD